MQRTGADAPRPPTRLAFAAELLGVTSIERLAASLVRRTMLPGGRFEAHEFGQNAHSTASAATLIGGLSGIPELPDRLVRSPITSAAALVDSAGNIRGYDGNPTIGTTNWAMSQLLLGLTLRRTLAAPYHDQIGKLVCGLIARQHQSGGWPLRAGEDPTLTFSFYPQLALARAHALGTSRDEKVRRSLQLGLRYTRSALSSGGLSPVERILAIHVLDRLNRHAGTTTAVDRNQVLTQSFSEVGSLRLEDEPVISFRQPMWHTVMWRPLLYLCLREWASPMSPVNAFLGNELLLTFDHRTSAWLGPGAAVSRGTGVSWASALALRAVVALAFDLQATGVSKDQFMARVQALSDRDFEYDVVISFGGPDRSLAEKISRLLKQSGLRVFYDRDHQHALLGEDLASYLHASSASSSFEKSTVTRRAEKIDQQKRFGYGGRARR